MKKRRHYARLFCIFALFSCAAAFAKNQKDASSVSGDIPVENTKTSKTGTVRFSKEEKKERKARAAAERKAALARRKLERKSSVPIKVVGMLGGEGVFQAKTMETTVGSIKLLAKGTAGTFQFYFVGKGTPVPVLAGCDEFTSSFFSLRVNNKEYRLTDKIGITVGARKDESGVQLIYFVPKVAAVHVKFECLQSDPNKNHDILKVTATVINKGKSGAEFALKNVLDTALGEQSLRHFSSAEDAELNSERQFRTCDSLKWIRSENKNAAVQFLLHGADITPPEAVTLGNKDVLMLQNWVTPALPERTFDSVLSYNNSALAINWNETHLEPEEQAAFIYYAVFADGGVAIDSGGIIADIEAGRIVSRQRSVETTSDSVGIPAEKLNYAYVQELLNRIDALENDADKINREEIVSLSAELDAIMEILRQSE